MRYLATNRFDRSVERLDGARKSRVKQAIEQLVAGFETGQLPSGLGITQLRPKLWELRAGLSDRILFYRASDSVEFLFVGNHDEIKRFLKAF